MEIYKIQNKNNKKSYVGITTQGWQKRVKRHFKDAETGGNYKLHNAIRKHGVDNFERTLLETCQTIEELKQREAYWIDVLKLNDDNFGYNMTQGGDGTFGLWHSEATKELQRRSANSRTSNAFVPIEITDGKTSIMFKNMTTAAKALGLNRNTVNNQLWRSGENHIRVTFQGVRLTLKRRDDLKTTLKPKLTKRDRDLEQVKQHMKMMQDKSSKARKENPEQYAHKQRMAKKALDIYQWDLDGSLIAIHRGARQAAEKTGVSRGGIRNCIRKKSYICKGFIWTLNVADKEMIMRLN